MKFQLIPFDAMWAKPFTNACTAILTTIIIAAPLGSSARAEDPAYFMTIYGTEPTGPTNPPANAHTWAVFVAAADGLAGFVFPAHDFSAGRIGSLRSADCEQQGNQGNRW